MISGTIKKVFLSAAVLASFSVYAVFARKTNTTEQNPVASVPLNQSSSETPSGSGRSSSSTIPSQPSTDASTLPPATEPKGQYADGTYAGPVINFEYGIMQVQAVVTGGKIIDVSMLQYPNDRPTSVQINQSAVPKLKQEVIAAQSASVDIVSGATQSTEAFEKSLAAALEKAKG